MAVYFRQLQIVAVICLLSAHLLLLDADWTTMAADLSSVSAEPVGTVAAGLSSVSAEPVGTVAAGLSSVSAEPVGTVAAGLSRSGPVDTGASTVMTEDQVIAGETTTVMMTLVDTSGLPVTGMAASQFEITFSDDYTRVVGGILKEVTPGVYRVQVLKLASGVLRIDIRVDGVLLDEQPEITYVHGPPVYIEIIRAPGETPAGELVDPLSVIVVDRLGNPVPGIEVTVELEDNNEFLAGTQVHTTDRDGFVEFNDLILKNSGQFRFILSAEGVDPVTSDPIGNRPEAPDPSRSVISAEPVTIVADGEETSLITVTLYDRDGKLRYRGGDEVYMATDFGELSPVVDRGFGRYTAQLTGESVGVATIIGYLGSSEEGDPLGFVEVELIEKGDDDGGDSGGDGPGDDDGDGSGGDEPGNGDGSDGSGSDGSDGNGSGPGSGGDGGSGGETGGEDDNGEDDDEGDRQPGKVVPAPVDLLSPADGDTLRLNQLQFTWSQSVATEEATITYVLHLMRGDGEELHVEALSDTSYSADENPFFQPNQTYEWWVVASDGEEETESTARFTVHTSPDIRPEYELSQNYPNPWRGSTTIRFRIPVRSAVVIEVFDVIGRRVETLVQDSSLEAGVHQMQWNASRLSGGVYICRMVVTEESGGRFMQSRQMTLLK